MDTSAFCPSEADRRVVLADKEQMPEGNFRQVCPRIGSLRDEGLGHPPRAFLLQDVDTGFDAGMRIEGFPESLGLRPSVQEWRFAVTPAR